MDACRRRDDLVDASGSCSPSPPSPASPGSTSSTTPRCARPPLVRAATRLVEVRGTGFGIAMTVDCNGRLRGARPLRGWQDRRGGGRAQRGLHAAPGRSASPTASTSAIRRSPRSSSSSARRAAAWAMPACASTRRSPGGNVSLYNENPTGRRLPHADHRHGRPARVARPSRCPALPATMRTRSSCWARPPESWAAPPTGRTSPDSSRRRRRRWTSTPSCRLSDSCSRRRVGADPALGARLQRGRPGGGAGRVLHGRSVCGGRARRRRRPVRLTHAGAGAAELCWRGRCAGGRDLCARQPGRVSSRWRMRTACRPSPRERRRAARGVRASAGNGEQWQWSVVALRQGVFSMPCRPACRLSAPIEGRPERCVASLASRMYPRRPG